MATKKAKVEYIGDADSLVKATKRASGANKNLEKNIAGSTGRMRASFAGLSKSAGLAGAAIGAGAAVGIKKSVAAFRESEVSNAKLQAQLKSSGISYGAHVKQIDKVIQATSKLASLDDEDLQDAFTNVVRATGSVKAGMKDMSLVADLARGKHMDVAKAGELLAKVHAGNIGPLKRMGIEFTKSTKNVDALKASTKHATPEQIKAAKAADVQANSTRALGLLRKKMAGQAEAYGKTDAGASDRMKVAAENLQEAVGRGLSPALAGVQNNVAGFVNGMVEGTGSGGRFVGTVRDLYNATAPVAAGFARATAGIAGTRGGIVTLSAVAGGLAGRFAFVKIVAGISAVKSAVDKLKAAMAAVGKANAFGLLMVGIGLVAGALVGLKLSHKNAATSARDLTDALDEERNALKRVRDLDLDAAQAKVQARSSALAVEQAERTLAAARKTNGRESLQAKQAEVDLAQARIQHKRDVRALKDVEGDATKTRREAADATAKATEKSKSRADTLRGEIDKLKGAAIATSGIGSASGKAGPAVGDMKRRQERLAEITAQLRTKTAELNTELGRLAKRKTLSISIHLKFPDGKPADINSGDILTPKPQGGDGGKKKPKAKASGLDIARSHAEGIKLGKQSVRTALAETLLFPLDDAIAKLEGKKAELQAKWDAIDARAQRSGLVGALAAARRGKFVKPKVGGGSSGQGASGGGLPVIAGGRFLQGQGLQVGESKYFGGVTTNKHKHYANDHYSGNSIDVNAAGGGAGEFAKLKAALAAIRERFGKSIQQAFIEDAGTANQHLHITFKAAAAKVARAAAAAVNGKGKSKGKGDDDRKPSGKGIGKAIGHRVVDKGAVKDALKALKEFDTQATRVRSLAKIDIQIKNVAKLQAFKDAIKGAREQMKDLASQAAQAWRAVQDKRIDGEHDAAISAIDNSAEAIQLRQMQSEDAATQDKRTTDQLTQDKADAELELSKAKTADEKKDAEKKLKDANDAITDYERQKLKDQLQLSIDSKKLEADDARDQAKGSLDEQTTNYEQGLNDQFDILGGQLDRREIAYSEWAGRVNKMLSGYGLTVAADPGAEGAIGAGPGAPTVAPPLFYVVGGQHGAGAFPGQPKATASKPQGQPKKKRASGGWTYPGEDYWVGETGPERFTPAVRGMVTPASRSGSGSGRGGGDVHFHGDVNIRNGMDVDRLGRKLSRGLNR